MTLFSRTSRGERLPLFGLFLLIIVVFSWVTFYVALRQGDIHVAASALPILHSIQADTGHFEKDVIGVAVPPTEGLKVTQVRQPELTKVRPPELTEVKPVTLTEVQADMSPGLKVVASTGNNADESPALKPAAAVTTEIKAEVTTVLQPTSDSKVQSNEGEMADKIKGHTLAGLNCDTHGGPKNDLAQEMVYWEDIPSDSKVQSKFKRPGQYMTFESDHGGWNNVSFHDYTSKYVHESITV